MFKRLVYLAFLCLCLPAWALHAQAPQTLDSALADLSQRLGYTVTANDLNNWTFAQSNYPDTSLGCPQTGAMYAQVITSGVQYTLTYGGNVYDYRVSADQKIVILCSTNAAPTPNPSENCPPAGDAAYLPPRLTIGAQGLVVAGGLPNLMRSGPGQSGSVVGEIPAGSEFTVLDGPRCSTLDKLIWWQVNYNGTQGWTAEGQTGTYWLQPAGTQPVAAATLPPAVNQRITADNALQLRRTADFGGQTGAAALSPDGKLAVMGLADGRLILYNPQTNTQVAMVENVHQDSVNGSGVSAIVFGADGRLLATAGQNGQIMTWDVGRNGTVGGGDRLTITWGTGDPSALGARATYLLPSGSASALAFSPDGLLFAAGGPDGKIYLWAHPAYTNPGEMPVPIMTLTAHTTSVMRLFFSNDGSQLFSIGADGSSAVWGVSPVAG